jgi:hypothetical protein
VHLGAAGPGHHRPRRRRGYGAIFADKCGTVDASEAKFDVNFDTNAIGGVKAFATPALAKNTFRIIPNS